MMNSSLISSPFGVNALGNINQILLSHRNSDVPLKSAPILIN